LTCLGCRAITPHIGRSVSPGQGFCNACHAARAARLHEGYAIEYLGRKLRPYWQRNNTTVQQMLADAESQYAALLSRGETFDRELTADLTRPVVRRTHSSRSSPIARRSQLMASRPT